MIFLAILFCHNRTFDSQSLSMIMKNVGLSYDSIRTAFNLS